MPLKSVTKVGKGLLLFFPNTAGREAVPQPSFFSEVVVELQFSISALPLPHAGYHPDD